MKWLKRAYLSENYLENTQEVVQNLPSIVVTLDASDNYVGQINETTFIKFDQLDTLNLRRTSLWNFDIKVLNSSKNSLKELNYIT